MPIHETAENLINEKKVLEFLTPLWDIRTSRHLGMSYGLDWALSREEGKFPRIWSFLEIKCRPGLSYGAPGGYFLSLQKVMRAREIHAETNKPCTLVVNFLEDENSPIYFCRSIFDHLPGSIIAGRWDRPEDESAIEPHVVYPWEAFRQLR